MRGDVEKKTVAALVADGFRIVVGIGDVSVVEVFGADVQGLMDVADEMDDEHQRFFAVFLGC